MWRRREERGGERSEHKEMEMGREKGEKKKQNCECMLLNIELIIHFFRLS
jgi:hypothetical protein